MRLFIILIFFISSLFCKQIVIKNGQVNLTINNVEKKFEDSQMGNVEEGNIVCFKNGEGVVIIDDKIQLNKPGKCYLIPIEKKSSVNEYVSKLSDAFLITFIDSTESVKHGVNTKGVMSLEDKSDIVLSLNQKKLIFCSDKIGPHPIFIKLLDEKGNIVINIENENSEMIFFEIDTANLKTGFYIQILNGFDEYILNKRIIKN